MGTNKKYVTKEELKQFETTQDKIYAEFAENVRYVRELFESQCRTLARRNAYLSILILCMVIALLILFSFHAGY